MSSRKDLKKQINESMSILYSDCILYKVFSKNADHEKADALIAKIAGLHNDLLARINVTEGKEVKDRVKTYYRKLREDLKKEVNQIGKEIENLA